MVEAVRAYSTAPGSSIPSASSSTADVSATSGTATPPMSKLVEEEIVQARAIPSTFRESLSAWWSSDEGEAEASETRMLRRIPFFRSANQPDVEPTASDPDPITARVSRVVYHPTDSKRFLNTVSFLSPSTKDSSSAVVLLHGYGAGLGFFYLNWKALAHASRDTGRRSYAVDWLGMGRSARIDPKELKAKAGKKATTEERVGSAENFFVDSLEQWRETQKIQSMTLVGHSLGGYLSLAYAMKYPTRVDRLILLSPAGIPASGDAIPGPTTQGQIPINQAAVNLQRELDESQDETTGGTGVAGTGSVEASATSTDADGKAEHAGQNAMQKEIDAMNKAQEAKGQKPTQPPRFSKFGRSILHYAWESGWSPMSIARSPWGPQLIGRYSSRRFASLPEEDIRDMHSYIYSISSAKGSGEYAITHLLAPGAHARLPMVNRVDKLKMPIAFLYGDRDWMDPHGGWDSVKKMKAAGNADGKVYIVKNAGHHVYLDGAEETNRIMEKLIKTPVGGKE